MIRLFVLFLLGMIIISCNKSQDSANCEGELMCPDSQCLFTLDNNLGTTLFISCYDRWGIFAPNSAPEDGNLWLIPNEWDSSFENEGLQIQFCGYIRENTIPLQFPDPSVGQVYQIDLEGVFEE